MFLFRGRRRKRLLETPLTEAQRQHLAIVAPICASLPADLRARYEGVVQLLLAEKHYEVAGDLVLNEAMPLAIAGQAALLQLRESAEYYPGLDTILIYPEAFTVELSEPDEYGFVHEGLDERAGESWQRGVVVISWQDAEREATRRDGYNVVLHEFAHQLDGLSGEVDGIPPLPTAELHERWRDAFQAAIDRHARSLRRRREVLFDADAGESPGEFFATAVELFFELPQAMKREFPAVHAVLAEYFELDPGEWTRQV
jgi:MtfA peptidase